MSDDRTLGREAALNFVFKTLLDKHVEASVMLDEFYKGSAEFQSGWNKTLDDLRKLLGEK